MKISQKKYLFPIKYSWRGIQEYLVCCHEFIVRNSFRKIYFLLSIFLFVSCDKVVQDVSPTQPPVIPQASTEVFKQIYPEVAFFIFKPLEPDKTWQIFPFFETTVIGNHVSYYAFTKDSLNRGVNCKIGGINFDDFSKSWKRNILYGYERLRNVYDPPVSLEANNTIFQAYSSIEKPTELSFMTYNSKGEVVWISPFANKTILANGNKQWKIIDNFLYISKTNIGKNSVAKIKFEEVQVYPNPSKDEFKIILPKSLKSADVKLFDTFGREHPLTYTGEQTQAGGLTQGVYFLRIQKGEKAVTSKIIIE